jgi:sec-independent protein translocase protein TatB
MMGIGWSELLVIAAVALIVVGPKDLPIMLRNLGKAMSVVRKMGNEFKREIDQIANVEELKEIKNLQQTVTNPVRSMSREITKEFNKLDGGKVIPTGKIKPTVPGAESVHSEIREAAGMSSEPAPAASRQAATPASSSPEVAGASPKSSDQG